MLNRVYKVMATQMTGERPHQVVRLTGERPYQVVRLSHLGELVRDVRTQPLASLIGTTYQAEKSKEDLLKRVSVESAAQMISQPSTAPKLINLKHEPAQPVWNSLALFKQDDVVVIDLCDETSDQDMEAPTNALKVEPLPEGETSVSDQCTISTHSTSKFSSLRGTTERTAIRQVSNDMPLASNMLIGTKCEKFSRQATLAKQEEDSLESWGLPATLPLQLLDQVHEWNDHNPGRTPPFAAMYNPKIPLYETLTGVKTSFWHKSGGKLKVGWYDLPEGLYPQATNQVSYLRLLVAFCGPLGPCFYRYSSTSGPPSFKARGTAYKAWIGFDGFNKNGFEFEPSMIKIADTRNTDETSPSVLSTGTSGNTSETQHKSSRRNRKPPQRYGDLVSWASVLHPQPASSARDVEDNESSQALLESFRVPTDNDDESEFTCTTKNNPAGLRSSSRLSKRTKPLTLSNASLNRVKNTHRIDKPRSKAVANATSPRCSLRALGFPRKYPHSSTNRHDANGNSNPAVKLTVNPPKLSEIPISTSWPKDLGHRIHADGSEQSGPRVPRIEEVAQQRSREIHDMTSIVVGDQSEIPKQGSFNVATTADYNEIDAHIRENTVVLFYADSSYSPHPPPRPRMISACNTSNKLFAQASAGSVFPSSHVAGKTKVLSLRFNNQAELIPVVEEDEEDFEAFIMTLRQASCWSRDGTGKMTGSCTVEVRAKA